VSTRKSPTPEITYEQIIEAFKLDGGLAEKVLIALNVGFWEEWDCDLLRGMLVMGFGPPELRIAAKAVPNDIDWEDGRRVGEEPTDIENRYAVHVAVHVKNSGSIRDMERERVQSLLVDEVTHQTRGLNSLRWVLEVEVA
jgi:hypothetical protein